ncbi:hypothetical protein ACFL27_27450 [candidate division CSSED10-310 bacterium]|uniref:Outer membrane lipoprotein carrier protein LolA n=1 Tax=candidate division CSSED10-310 bacterium TaxID=2855610 RepID=A0ABV6Z673_UNCC1
MKHIFWIVMSTLVSFFLMVPALWADITSIENLELLIKTNMEPVRTLSLQYRKVITMGQMTMNDWGIMYFQLPDKMRIEGRTGIVDQNVTIVHDGHYIWRETNISDKLIQVYKTDLVELEKLNQRQALSAIKAQDMDLTQIIYPLTILKETFTLLWLGRQKLNDETVYGIEATLSSQARTKFQTYGKCSLLRPGQNPVK